MRVLLDTQLVFWSFYQTARLSATAADPQLRQYSELVIEVPACP